jgi:hypothetical protein
MREALVIGRKPHLRVHRIEAIRVGARNADGDERSDGEEESELNHAPTLAKTRVRRHRRALNGLFAQRAWRALSRRAG